MTSTSYIKWSSEKKLLGNSWLKNVQSFQRRNRDYNQIKKTSASTFKSCISTLSWTRSTFILLSRLTRHCWAIISGSSVSAKARSSLALNRSIVEISSSVSSCFWSNSDFQKFISVIRCSSFLLTSSWVCLVRTSVSWASRKLSSRSLSAAACSCSALKYCRWFEACHSSGVYFGGGCTNLAILLSFGELPDTMK